MKILFRISLIAAFILGVISFTSCKKEEPLEPNILAAGPQSPFFNPFDTTGSGGGTGGGGGGTGGGNPVNEYFTATIDGSPISFNNYSYLDNGISVAFSGFSTTSPRGISFALFGSLSNGLTIDLGGTTDNGTYNRGVGDVLNSSRGELFIDEVGSNFVRGTFFFTAVSINNPNDSVLVENGTFQIEK
jgi:hypothetical protein